MLANLPALVIVVPLLAALLVPLLGMLWRGISLPLVTLALGFSCAGSIALLVQVVESGPITYAMGGWAAPAGIEYHVDRLNGIVLSMVATVAFLTAVWMGRGLGEEVARPRRASFHAVYCLSVVGLLGITITNDVFNLYVFLEISSITSYVLVAMGRKRQALFAGYTYLIVGSIGATFILLGIGHLYMATGTLSMADLATRIPPLYDSTVIRTAFAFFTVGLAIKMALFPLHGWQPSAYARAPAAASIFIAATATKVSAYAMYRLSFDVFGTPFERVLPEIPDAIALLSGAAIVVGPLLALRQTDLKRLLAYSSVGQIGYIMLGVVLLNPDGVTGGLVHFWNHAAAKGALFCAAGALVYTTGSAKVKDLAGLARRAPWTAVTMTLAGLSMIGVPLTAGFLSKYYLAVGALEAEGRWFLVPVLLISSLLTAVYVYRLLMLVWFAPTDVPSRFERDVPWSMRLPGLVLAAACLVFGLTHVGVDLARTAAEALLR